MSIQSHHTSVSSGSGAGSTTGKTAGPAKKPRPPSTAESAIAEAARKSTSESASTPLTSRRVSVEKTKEETRKEVAKKEAPKEEALKEKPKRETPVESASSTSSSSTAAPTASTVATTTESSPTLELMKNAEDLSSATQEMFVKALAVHQSTIGGLKERFISTDKDYDLAKDNLDKAAACERFRKAKESEESQYRKIRGYYDKPFFVRRVQLLHTTVMKFFIEFSFLHHAIIGNDTCLQNSSLWHFKLGRYGVHYRLWELNNRLSELSKAAGIKLEETLPTISEDLKEPSSKDDSKELTSLATPLASFTSLSIAKGDLLREKLKQILEDMVKLKEHMTICFEALQLKIYPSFEIAKKMKINNPAFQEEMREAIAKSRFPQKYYLAYNQRFEVLNSEMNEIFTSLIPARIVALNELITAQARTPFSTASKAYQQEKAELIARQAKISERQVEITNLLQEMKKHFKLGEGASEIPSALEELSPEYTKAHDLVDRVTALKEEALVVTSWDSSPPTLFRFSKRALALKAEVLSFQKKNMTSRIELIDSLVETYRIYIASMLEKMNAIDAHVEALDLSSVARSKWKLDDPTKASPPEASGLATTSSTASSSSWFSFAFLWGGASTAASGSSSTSTAVASSSSSASTSAASDSASVSTGAGTATSSTSTKADA